MLDFQVLFPLKRKVVETFPSSSVTLEDKLIVREWFSRSIIRSALERVSKGHLAICSQCVTQAAVCRYLVTANPGHGDDLHVKLCASDLLLLPSCFSVLSTQSRDNRSTPCIQSTEGACTPPGGSPFGYPLHQRALRAGSRAAPPARCPSGASRSLPGRAPAPHTQGQRPGLGARGRGSSASGRHEPPVRGCPVMGSGAGPAGAPPAAGST